MKKIKILLIFTFIPLIGISQSLSISSPSFQIWGQSDELKFSISFTYKDVGIHYFNADESRHLWRDSPKQYWGQYQSTFAISYTPINIKDIVNIGGIYSFRKFPTDMSNKFNFWVEAGINVSSFKISYVHISNGFGVFNKINPGVDRIVISYNF